MNRLSGRWSKAGAALPMGRDQTIFFFFFLFDLKFCPLVTPQRRSDVFFRDTNDAWPRKIQKLCSSKAERNATPSHPTPPLCLFGESIGFIMTNFYLLFLFLSFFFFLLFEEKKYINFGRQIGKASTNYCYSFFPPTPLFCKLDIGFTDYRAKREQAEALESWLLVARPLVNNMRENSLNNFHSAKQRNQRVVEAANER